MLHRTKMIVLLKNTKSPPGRREKSLRASVHRFVHDVQSASSHFLSLQESYISHIRFNMSTERSEGITRFPSFQTFSLKQVLWSALQFATFARTDIASARREKSSACFAICLTLVLLGSAYDGRLRSPFKMTS